jgi:hypothetical protein
VAAEEAVAVTVPFAPRPPPTTVPADAPLAVTDEEATAG